MRFRAGDERIPPHSAFSGAVPSDARRQFVDSAIGKGKGSRRIPLVM